MTVSPPAEDWLVWGIHCTESPYDPGGWHLVVEFPAVKEMIDLLAQGWVTADELHHALDAFAQRFHTTLEEPSSSMDSALVGEDCPHGCSVCAAARSEFDAIAIESFTHKVRLADPERHPYAAGKNTLHRSCCPKVARFVGYAEPLESPWHLAGLPAFAHQGVFSTSWAAGMRVMTVEEAAEWVSLKSTDTGYKRCRHCLPPVMGTEWGTTGEGFFDPGYWSVESAVTWS